MTIAHAEMSLLRGNFTSNATAQQPLQKSATTHATGAQQAATKPASLLDIARNKLRNSHASSSPNSTQQAPQKTSEDVAQEITSWRWLVHCPDRDFEISTVPESSLAQVLLDFPAAKSAEPILDMPKRKATCSETTVLTELVDLIYANDSGADRAEALAAALADPDDALTCYRAIALQIPMAASLLHGNVIAPHDKNKRDTAHPSAFHLSRRQAPTGWVVSGDNEKGKYHGN